MRRFHYYLYSNIEPAPIGSGTEDPRLILNTTANGVLSAIIGAPPGECRYGSLCDTYSTALINSFIACGLLRREGESLFLDSTVIVSEDTASLRECFSAGISHMADRLEENKSIFYHAAKQIDNGFLPEVNLYHILCGHVFDGLFFDFLGKNNIVSTSRTHDTGLDYIITVYENAPQLNAISKKLLCSYNRYTDGRRALQSFGDSDGTRIDFYRYSVQKALGTASASLSAIERSWDLLNCGDNISILLDEAQRFADTGRCMEPYEQLLTFFGYGRDGKISVPVYRKRHLPTINAIEKLVEKHLYKDMATTLLATAVQSDLLCSQHGVAPREIANELYHVVFGQLNQMLVTRKFVAAPDYHPGEVRYLKSNELL
ncbi:MAG: hypothetical protein ABIK64_07285 [Bacillota bacterium]